MSSLRSRKEACFIDSMSIERISTFFGLKKAGDVEFGVKATLFFVVLWVSLTLFGGEGGGLSF